MNCFAFAICSSNKKLFSVLYFLRGGYVAAQQQRGCARLMIYSSQTPKSAARRRNINRAAVPGWPLKQSS
ncbi:LOW QUALITY PROTEIN: hypothetical protein PanWU01x14_036340 [Parasponia andersonii]|uniref:Uncharacterized protein n=1 Tax=Parasponia andersonii TaxID=3476 RepID=A0A2P5DSF3_PARAD|nr:LOW QUALITY PROTEIN: hypothetical protein PanWU01x14_036340 [Parasponia andersonii]